MRIPRNVLNAHKLTDPDSTRYALGGCRIQRVNGHAVRISATDGRCGIIAEWQEDQPSDPQREHGTDTIIGADACKTLLRFARPSKMAVKKVPSLNYLEMQESDVNGRAHFLGCDGKGENPQELDIETIAGRFPDLPRVFPAPDNGDAITLVNARILRDTLSALIDAVPRSTGYDYDHTTVELRFAGDKSVVLMSAVSDDCNAVAGVMPLGRKGANNTDYGWRPGRIEETEGGA